MKPFLWDLDHDELTRLTASFGAPKFRVGQIENWIARGALSFDEMTNLPASFREDLKSALNVRTVRDLSVVESALDDTKKFFYTLLDGEHVEAVLMHYEYGYSVCISTQAGCKMGCAFCASSRLGFGRNLSCAEMLGELFEITRFMRETHPDFRIGHLVLMGIGEPMDNYENVLKFLRAVTSGPAFQISARNVSLSTCGIVPKIHALSRESIPLTLSVSLHAPTDAIRDRLMPINRTYPLNVLIPACRAYYETTKRRVYFEYALIKDVNDGVEHARSLAGLIRGFDAHVNLIPMNDVPGSKLCKSPEKQQILFTNTLKQCKISVTVRRTLGADIEAACGQLRRNAQQAT